MTDGGIEQVDCVVIGAGVVGLAAARALAMAGRDVLILESQNAFGTGISARNSEVIHAGMYYAPGSAKAGFCVQGNRLLQHYAASHGVPHRMTGKLIVATDSAEEAQLQTILDRAQANGVQGLHPISAAQARQMEPELSCTSALFSPQTGIIDSHGLMLSLLGQAQDHGASLALNAPVIGGGMTGSGMIVQVGGAHPMRLRAASLVIAAGLSSCPVARSLGLAQVPQEYLCKGNYFTLTGSMPFGRLVYPVPVAAGLGVHYTLDLGGRGRFGPDVEWTDQMEYGVDPARCLSFYQAIRRYWPGLPDGALEPAYAGIRPKINAPNAPAADFAIHGPDQHGADGVVALYGIESPGLTSCLAIAAHIREILS